MTLARIDIIAEKSGLGVVQWCIVYNKVIGFVKACSGKTQVKGLPYTVLSDVVRKGLIAIDILSIKPRITEYHHTLFFCPCVPKFCLDGPLACICC